MVNTNFTKLITEIAHSYCPKFSGRGERFQIDYTHGTKRTSTFNSNFVKPLHDAARTALGASLFQQLAEFPPSGFRELNRGLRADLVSAGVAEVCYSDTLGNCQKVSL